jgi:DNA mismatch endonuclease (patch repair protein)
VKNLRRTADIVFTRQRLAVFIDGCYWHSCPVHRSQPVVNADYWAPKLKRNRERDEDTNAQLRAAGWTVIRFWEHDDVLAVAAQIRQAALAGQD